MPYQVPPTWVNDSVPKLNAANLGILSGNDIDHESRIGTLEAATPDIIRLRASGVAATDQANMTAALTAANAATSGAVIYASAGDYTFSGGFTKDPNVVIVGAGRGLTRFFHTGNNALFTTSTGIGGIRHGYSDFAIWGPGTSGTTAVGILQQNSYGMYLKGIDIGNYKGTSGVGFEIHNSVTYSEGILVFDCRFVDNTKHIYGHKSGTGTDSLSDFDIIHTVLLNKDGMTGIHLDGVVPYASHWLFKIMNEMTGDGTNRARGFYFTNGGGIVRSLVDVTIEGATSTAVNSGNGVVADGTHSVSFQGEILMYDTTGSPMTHSITSGSGFWRSDPTIGGRISVSDTNRTLDGQVDPYLVSYETPLTANRTVSVFHNNKQLPGRRFRLVRAETTSSPYTLTLNYDSGQTFVFPSYTQGWIEVQYSGSGWKLAGSYLEPRGSNLAISTPYEVDDFTSGNATSGQIGAWGWNKSGTGSITRLAATGNHPGIISIDTSGTSGTSAYIVAATPANTGFLADGLFDQTFTVKLAVTDANAAYRIGLTSDETTQTPAEGAYFEKLAADTQWFPVTRLASTQTRGTALATTDTSWHSFRVRRLTSTSVGFSIDSGTEQVLTTNLPTGGVSLFCFAVNSAAASKSMQVDRVQSFIGGLSRT